MKSIHGRLRGWIPAFAGMTGSCGRWATALCLALAGAAQAASAVPDLDAVVTYETRQMTAAGVLRTEVWKERLLRRGDTVWTERLLPPQAKAAHAHEPAHDAEPHKHFDFEGAARWLRVDAAGKTDLRFVDAAHRQVVSVPAAEYGAVGFDGRYDAAAFIVPPSVIAHMSVQAGTSSEGRWRVERHDGWSHRVLWSETRGVALRVESERSDGSFRRIVTVEATPPAAQLPWSTLSDYRQMEYDDFMD